VGQFGRKSLDYQRASFSDGVPKGIRTPVAAVKEG
jgi:hypothetical protein